MGHLTVTFVPGGKRCADMGLTARGGDSLLAVALPAPRALVVTAFGVASWAADPRLKEF